MSDSPNKRLVERAIAAWGSKRAQEFLDVFHDDVIYDDVPLGKVMRGHKEFQAFYDNSVAAFPDIDMKLLAAVADGENGGAEWTLSGTHTGDTDMMGKATGKRFEIRGASVVRFKDGKIAYLADYWNMTDLVSQLGLG